MLFRSRRKRGLWDAFRGWLWPRKGLERPWIYVRHRIIRLPDTPHGIAAGFACGVAASLTPLIGLHFLLAALLAWLARGNIIASAIGTGVGNPWTFPLIWLSTYELGTMMLGMRARLDPFVALSWEAFVAQPWATFLHLIGPMLLGSLPLAICAWWLTYWPMKRLVAFYRARRQTKKRGDNGAGAARPA